MLSGKSTRRLQKGSTRILGSDFDGYIFVREFLWAYKVSENVKNYRNEFRSSASFTYGLKEIWLS